MYSHFVYFQQMTARLDGSVSELHLSATKKKVLPSGSGVDREVEIYPDDVLPAASEHKEIYEHSSLPLFLSVDG